MLAQNLHMLGYAARLRAPWHNLAHARTISSPRPIGTQATIRRDFRGVVYQADGLTLEFLGMHFFRCHNSNTHVGWPENRIHFKVPSVSRDMKPL
jgi:hypothetical protein